MNYGLFKTSSDGTCAPPEPTSSADAAEAYKAILTQGLKPNCTPMTQLGALRKAMQVMDNYAYNHPKHAERSPAAIAAQAELREMARQSLANPSFVVSKEMDELFREHCTPSSVELSCTEAAAVYKEFQEQRLLGLAGRAWQAHLTAADPRMLVKPEDGQSAPGPVACIDGITPSKGAVPITAMERFNAMDKFPMLRKVIKKPVPPPQPVAAAAPAPPAPILTTTHQSNPSANKAMPPWAAKTAAAAIAPQQPNPLGGVNVVNAQDGGFMTATSQYNLDVQAGKIAPPRPNVGLRRAPPPPPQAPNQTNIDSVIAATHKNTGAQKKKEEGGEGDDFHLIPPSLLLPDGTLDPRLEGLEPKLLAQVAMEILDSKGNKTSWADIAGLQHAKDSVEEAIVWPLINPQLFTGLRDPPRGLLLFGPPGTGKTMIARAIASRAGCTFMNISASSLMSKWVGEGEKLVRCMFAVACVKQPTVVFIDEIDSLLSMRSEGEMDAVRRVKTEFLVQMDGVGTDRNDRVLLIGATNRPEELDEAARRRMEKRLYIPLPDAVSRTELLRRLITSHKHSLSDEDFKSLGESTDGYSGADIKGLAREAAMGPVRALKKAAKKAAAADGGVGGGDGAEGNANISSANAEDVRPVSAKDCMNAVKRIKPSVGSAELVRYESWNDQYGSFPMNGGGDMDDDSDDDE